MDLQTLQRKLFDMVVLGKSPSPNDEPYLRDLSGSRPLAAVREISQWWAKLRLEEVGIFTVNLLKKLDLFDQILEEVVYIRPHSPFPSEMAIGFLTDLKGHSNSLVASVAAFELALNRVNGGEPDEFVVDWNYNPYHVLECLFQNQPLNLQAHEGHFQTVLSRDIPSFFKVFQVTEQKAEATPRAVE